MEKMESILRKYFQKHCHSLVFCFFVCLLLSSLSSLPLWFFMHLFSFSFDVLERVAAMAKAQKLSVLHFISAGRFLFFFVFTHWHLPVCTALFVVIITGKWLFIHTLWHFARTLCSHVMHCILWLSRLHCSQHSMQLTDIVHPIICYVLTSSPLWHLHRTTDTSHEISTERMSATNCPLK